MKNDYLVCGIQDIQQLGVTNFRSQRGHKLDDCRVYKIMMVIKINLVTEFLIPLKISTLYLTS